MNKVIYVYENFSSENPRKLGVLYVDIVRGVESYSFEYCKNWLTEIEEKFVLDPDLSLFEGKQYPMNNNMFGIFLDSCPDRWGRILMKRREAILSEKENRKPNTLFNSDYLLGVYDETRIGALRFSLIDGGPFLSDDKDNSIPPFEFLKKLEQASISFESNEETYNDEWLKVLMKPGSSLGGARPKACVIDNDDNLWIAKFPARNDEWNVGAWEKVVNDLAKLCDLNVPESKLCNFSKYGSTFLVKRFDREKGKRIHFSSAMNLLGKNDGVGAEDGVSYLDIASFIRQTSIKPKADLLELWKRIVFNMVISNTDDHLRNHGFILTNKGWRLSPLYDINPVPYGKFLSLNVNDVDNRISIINAIECAKYFGVDYNDAKIIADKIINIVKNNWEKLARKYNISKDEIKFMSPAFGETKNIID